MAAKPEPPRKKPSMVGILGFVLVLFLLFDPSARDMVGRAAGFVLEPILGFGGRYPVLTILLTGTVMVLLSTLVRHFTTDWLAMARTQAYLRAYQKEFSQARKENNTYKMKALQEQQPKIMQKQQEMSAKQLKLMPLTLVIVIPFFTWMLLFLQGLDYRYFSAPWNPNVHMFEATLFPHWILLYTALSIPLGMLAQRIMKYLSWKERWKPRHPEVHD